MELCLFNFNHTVRDIQQLTSEGKEKKRWVLVSGLRVEVYWFSAETKLKTTRCGSVSLLIKKKKKKY